MDDRTSNANQKDSATITSSKRCTIDTPTNKFTLMYVSKDIYKDGHRQHILLTSAIIMIANGFSQVLHYDRQHMAHTLASTCMSQVYRVCLRVAYATVSSYSFIYE